jgi:hypothetical protein
MRLALRSAVLVLASGLVRPTPGAALVLCVKRSRVVVQRTACKKKEKPLDVGQFVVIGPKGDPGGTAVPCASQVGTEVFFTGCNVNIQSGSGSTDGPVNGLGNLSVGYNANVDAHDRRARTTSASATSIRTAATAVWSPGWETRSPAGSPL